MLIELEYKLRDYLGAVGERFKEEMRKDGHYATGKTERSVKIIVRDDSITLKSAVAPRYLTIGSTAVVNGSQGSGILYNAILEWVKAKKVTPSDLSDKTFAYLIFRKRVEEGYRVPNRYNDGGTMERAIDLEKIKKDCMAMVDEAMAVEVSNLFKIV